jgi:hypothetical protein
VSDDEKPVELLTGRDVAALVSRKIREGLVRQPAVVEPEPAIEPAIDIPTFDTTGALDELRMAALRSLIPAAPAPVVDELDEDARDWAVMTQAEQQRERDLFVKANGIRAWRKRMEQFEAVRRADLMKLLGRRGGR